MPVNTASEAQELFAVFLILIPSALYILGLIEGRKGGFFFLSGLFVHLMSIIQRALILGTIPFTERHDNISFMAFSMAVTYWYFSRRKDMPSLSVTALPLISVFTLIPLVYTPVDTIPLLLKTPWFYLYRFFYLTGYGFFGISASIGIHYLLSGRSEHELLQYKAAIHGWIMLSIGLVAGSIWFFRAYGTYWLWTSRELWIALLWFYYGLYLHARLLKGLKGRPAAVLGCLGFAVALFAYFGVGAIIPAPPEQF